MPESKLRRAVWLLASFHYVVSTESTRPRSSTAGFISLAPNRQDISVACFRSLLYRCTALHWEVAKSKLLRWVHRAVAQSAHWTGREASIELGMQFARDGRHAAEAGAMSRRDALKTLGALAALPVLTSAGCGKERRLANTSVAIVGGGLAGLTAALRLKDLGMSPVVYERSQRFGGRAWTVDGVLPEGRRFEAGGEFIDQQHERMLGLADRFGVVLDDLEALDLEGMRYLIQGQEVTLDELTAATEPFLPAFLADSAALEANYDAKAVELDALTCTEYWNAVGVNGVLRAVLEVAMVTEFGREPSHISALHFVEDLPQVHDGSVGGDGMERYKFRDGTQALVSSMVNALGGMSSDGMRTGFAIQRVSKQGRGFTLEWDGHPPEEVDIVLLALPLPALRTIEFQGIDIPSALADYIADTGMGTHAKVIAGVDSKPWSEAGYDGEVLTDAAPQTCWDSNPLLQGPGSLTFLLGGEAGAEVHANDADGIVTQFVEDLAPLNLGLSDIRSGHDWAINWAEEEGYGGSYSCLDRGQYTAAMDHFFFGGDEDERQVSFVGHLGFIGEAFSGDFWGYMEGAAQTGWMAAHHVVDELA